MAKQIVIALDDGHEYNTPGKRTPKFSDGSFMKEWEFNNAVKRLIMPELKRLGFKIVDVNPTKENTTLATRVRRANEANADLYLSIHANAFKGVWGDANGIETYTYPSGESKRIGTIIHKHLMKGTKLRDRGVKDGSWLYVIRNTKMPAVLVECGFMDNKREAKLLMSDAYRQECADELVMGICEAFGVKYNSSNTISKPAKPKQDSKPKTKSTSKSNYEVGDKVKIKTSAGKYSRSSLNIPSQYKNKTYTIQQVGTNDVLIKELYSWVKKSDLVGNTTTNNTTTKPKPQPIPTPTKTSNTLKVGSKVKIKSSAKTYSRSTVSIPSKFKNKTYTVQQVGANDILIKELYSWVKKSDLVGNTTTSSNSTPKTSSFKVGQTVTVKRTAKRFATGQTIAPFVKGSKYKILQVKSDRVLLDGIMSWVKKSDVQ